MVRIERILRSALLRAPLEPAKLKLDAGRVAVNRWLRTARIKPKRTPS